MAMKRVFTLLLLTSFSLLAACDVKVTDADHIENARTYIRIAKCTPEEQ